MLPLQLAAQFGLDCHGLHRPSTLLFLSIIQRLIWSRLRQLDESNGHTALGHNGDDVTDSAEGARTGQVHAAAKEDIVRHWLQGSLDNVSPSGQPYTASSLALLSCTMRSLLWTTARVPPISKVCIMLMTASLPCLIADPV